MDTGFLIYQKRLELWDLLYPHWVSEITSAKYLGIIVFIILAYMLWWKLADKRQLTGLLLYGALISLGAAIVDAYGVESGIWLYRAHILPMDKSFILHILTITPLTLMLAYQYSRNWRQFIIWNAVGSGVISFVIKPVLAVLGIYQLMRWNYLYTFILLYAGATLARGIVLYFLEVEKKAAAEAEDPPQNTVLRPAFKPLNKDDGNKK